MPRMEVTNLRKAGQFFIKLAKRELPIPSDADRKAVLRANGVNVDDYDNVEFCVDNETTIHFVIRGEAVIREGQARVDDPTQGYTLHPDANVIYERFYDDPPLPEDISRKQELFDTRVGDYTVTQCR